MNFNKNTKEKLSEWRNRFYASNNENINNNYRFFIDKILSNGLLSEILSNASKKHLLSKEELEIYKKAYFEEEEVVYLNEEHAASIIFQVIVDFYKNNTPALNLLFIWGVGGSFDENFRKVKQNFIEPIINYLFDELEESNIVLYLLEKYKARTEWFLHKNLLAKYNVSENNFEQIFDDDLRLYLFDQGIEHPFSTPKSASGRADIIGLLDTSNPLIMEIKVYDSQKNYRKNRIIDGFSQAVKYANDFNKNSAYIVIFNVNNVEIQITSESDKIFPPMISFNNKNFYFIVINLNFEISASKVGKLDVVTVSKEELINPFQG